jgi:hypothetical protein
MAFDFQNISFKNDAVHISRKTLILSDMMEF